MPLTVVNEAELNEVRKALFAPHNESAWLHFGWEGHSSSLRLLGAGGDNLGQLFDTVSDDQISYGVIRLRNADGSNRDVFFNYIGKNVSSSESEQKALWRPDVEELLKPFDASVTILNPHAFTYENLYEKTNPENGGGQEGLWI